MRIMKAAVMYNFCLNFDSNYVCEIGAKFTLIYSESLNAK